jgi:hypothetical protein
MNPASCWCLLRTIIVDYASVYEACFGPRIAACISPVKTADFNDVKRQEAQNRMAAVRQARRSPQAAGRLQRRASLVGHGAKWRITNFKQVARAMSKWA